MTTSAHVGVDGAVHGAVDGSLDGLERAPGGGYSGSGRPAAGRFSRVYAGQFLAIISGWHAT
jgi:hypothetical protein